MSASPQRVLIVKLGAIGDVVMTLPAALALHRTGYAVDWVCGISIVPLLRCFPWIRVIPVDDSAIFAGSPMARLLAFVTLWRRLSGVRYALCATLYYDARYRLVSLPVRADRRLQLSTTERETLLIQGRNRRDEFTRLLLGALGGWQDSATDGFVESPQPVGLPPNPLGSTTGTARILACPGGARNLLRDDPVRRWPLDRYAALARRLLAEGREVVLVGGPDDHWVEAAFAGLPVTNAIDRCNLAETLALMNESDLIVTHDTGPMHLAGLSSISMLSIFGPTDPRAWSPQKPGCDAIWGGKRLSCRPCYDGFRFAPCETNLCMQSISVEAVHGAVTALLRDRATGTARPSRLLTT